jgi:four helix bundle protein
MKGQELKDRTKAFALRIMNLIDALPKSVKGRVIANQLMRSGTSVAPNYRAACLARSTAEIISRMGLVEEEADESALWLELIVDDKILPERKVSSLLKEANELVAVTAASSISAARNPPRRDRSRTIQHSEIINHKSTS